MGKSGFWGNFITAVTENRSVSIALVTVVALRLIFIWMMGLMPQDAYYSFYGEHLALSYYDHPPAIAWLLRGFTELLGKKVWVIKLADSVTTGLTALCFYYLARHFLGVRGGVKALLLFLSTFMATILCLVSTPDIPLMLCWTLSLTCLYKALFQERKHYFLWAGILMGLAFDSKYTGVFLPMGLLLFLILSKQHRRLLLSPWPWCSLLLFALATWPVVVWNVQHDFVSFRFQSSDRMEGLRLSPLDFLGTVGHQAAILIPVLLSGLVYLLYRTFRKYRLHIARIPSRKLFLLCFFVPVFVGFFLLSFVYWVKLNWMMPAYISGIIWVSVYFNRKYLRWQWISSLVIHVALAVELLFYPVPVNSDDIWMGWGRLAREVKSLKAEYPDHFIFAADDYKTSAVLNFYLDELVYSQNVIGRPALQFDYIGTDLTDLKGRSALFINSIKEIGDEKDEREFIAVLQQHFRTVTPLKPIVVKRHGNRVVRKFLVYRCTGYHL